MVRLSFRQIVLALLAVAGFCASAVPAQKTVPLNMAARQSMTTTVLLFSFFRMYALLFLEGNNTIIII